MGWHVTTVVLVLVGAIVAFAEPVVGWLIIDIAVLVWLLVLARRTKKRHSSPLSYGHPEGQSWPAHPVDRAGEADVVMPVEITPPPGAPEPPPHVPVPMPAQAAEPQPEPRHNSVDRLGTRTLQESAPKKTPPLAGTRIVSRTSINTSGHLLKDLHGAEEKSWTNNEQIRLLDLYEAGGKIRDVAAEMRIDQNQVAIRLIRLLLDPKDDIRNEDGALRHGKTYSKAELVSMTDALNRGATLKAIAEGGSRTQLGVGWRLLDMGAAKVPQSLKISMSAGT